MLPQAFGVNSSASALLTLWAQKGFSARELAALLGAHSVSQAFAQQQNGIKPGSKSLSPPSFFNLLIAMGSLSRHHTNDMGRELLQSNPEPHGTRQFRF